MLVNYQIDEDGRLQSVTEYPIDETKPTLELPDGFMLDGIQNFVLRNGELLYEARAAVESAVEKIAALKQKLANTDYITAKAVDAMATADSLPGLLIVLKTIRTEYADVLAQRAAWRKEINDLEEKGDDA